MSRSLDTKIARMVQRELNCSYQTALNIVRQLLASNVVNMRTADLKELIKTRAVEQLRRWLK